MPYEIADVNGVISHGPSINGLKELREELNHVADARTFPQTNMFFKHGYATSPLAFKVELGQLKQKVQCTSCQATIQTLIDAASKSKEIVILRH